MPSAQPLMAQEAFKILTLTFVLQTFEIVGFEQLGVSKPCRTWLSLKKSLSSPSCTPLGKIY